MRRLKVELHLHTSEDPLDRIDHTPEEIVRRAAALGFDAVAFTCHERWSAGDAWARAAADALGVALIPGIEATLDGAHVVILGSGPEVERLRTLDDLARWKRRDHLVIAPHPLYPGPTSLGPRLEERIELFDAIEWSHFWSRRLRRWNRAAARVAERHGKPLVGTSDVHFLDQLGRTYSIVEARSSAPAAIIEAIRAGAVEVVTRPLSEARMAWSLARLAWRTRPRKGERRRGTAPDPLARDRVPEPRVPEPWALRP